MILEKSGGGEKTSVGRVVVFEQKMFPCKAMFANFSECLRLKRNLHNEKYCAYLLKALYYTKDMSCFYHQTTGIQNLDIAEYLSMDLCFPSRKEQDVIVDCLNEKLTEVDKLIEVQQAQIEKLKEYKQSVITEAVTKGLDPTAPMKDSGVYNIGFVPKEWNIRKLKTLVTICNGKEVIVDEGNIPVYGSGGVFKYTDRPLFEGVSLLYGRKGSIDKPLLVDGAFWTVDTMFYTSKISGIMPKYLYYCSVSLIDFPFYKSGSVLPSMTQTELGNAWITCPSMEQQAEIVEYLDDKCAKIDKLIALKQSKIEKLQEYKKSLIYEYVTGKKEVM